MRYAKLPFDVPGVTGPRRGSQARRSTAADLEPVLVHELPRPLAKEKPRVRIPRTVRRRHGARERRRREAIELLEALPVDQRAAVGHGKGPLLVFAGPGTGKTHTIASRIAYLHKSGLARLHEILAVTFSVRAADEMRLRLIELVGTEAAAQVTVCTIHSLCHRIIRAHADRFGRDKEFVVADRATLRQTARTLLAEPGEGELAEAIGAFAGDREELADQLLAQISDAKSRLWSIEAYLEHSESDDAELVVALWRALEARMRDANAFDFDDLLICTAALLREPRLRRYYRGKYPWILIDEFQDTNVAQLEIVNQLAAPDGNLTVVGDDDQGLYAFRQADAEQNILRFTEWFPDATTVTLEHNRRSRKEILDAALRLIAHNARRVAKRLTPLRGAGGFVGVRSYATDEDEAEDVAKLIADDIALGRKPGQILVLCRNMKPMRHLQTRLQERGIKVRLVGDQSLWERSEVRDAIAYLQLLANPYDRAAYERAVTAPRDRRPFRQGGVKAPTRGIEKGVKAVFEFAREQRIDLIDATMRAEEIKGVRKPAVGPLLEFATGLDRIRRASWAEGPARPSLSGLVDHTLRIPGGPMRTYTLLRDEAQSSRVREDATRILEDLRSLVSTARTYEETSSDAMPTLAGFVASLHANDGMEVEFASDDRVTLSTIHAAKGTEAQTVIVIGVEEGLLPDFRSLGDPRLLEQERKVLYAAFTRAIDNLLVTWVAVRDYRPTGGPSCLLPEAGLI